MRRYVVFSSIRAVAARPLQPEVLAALDAGRLITANDAGTRLPADFSLLTLNGATVCLPTTCPEPITQQIARAPEHGHGRRVLLGYEDGTPAPRIITWPLRRHSARAFGLIILDEDDQLGPDRDLIGSLYGLSAAEVRVAEQMFAGRSAGEAAEHLCVNVETVRTHLKSLYVKMRTAGRGDLLRRLAHVAGLRTDSALNLTRKAASRKHRRSAAPKNAARRREK